MNERITEKFIKSILELHPSECVFELDAPKNIAERLSGKTMDEWLMKQNRDEFKACWNASEIYCPHEGIDRLAECGVKSLDWELV
jgi:hypothetical protein